LAAVDLDVGVLVEQVLHLLLELADLGVEHRDQGGQTARTIAA
jgi:hypothetical protein